MKSTLLLTGLVALSLACGRDDPSVPESGPVHDGIPATSSIDFPRPTEHRLDEDAERRNKAARRAWVEGMHRAAPGTDWRAIERANGLAAQERRRGALATAGAGTGKGRSSMAATSIGTWRELGSRNLAGRMHAAVRSTDGQSLYAGSSLGGLFKGGLDGTGWTPLGDNLYGGAHEVAAVPGGTGKPDVLIRLHGGLVHRTEDEGLTWSEPAGLNGVDDSKRILVLDDATSTVFLLAHKYGAWRVLVSTDRGASFTGVRNLGDEGDIWTPRTAPGPVYVLDGDRIDATQDGGATWTAVGSPLPASGDRALLAGSETPSLRFNAALRQSGVWKLWRSTDGGATWTYLRDLDDFWESLAASTRDGDLIAYAGVELHVSRDGGGTWNKVNAWGDYYGDPAHKLHADIPGLTVVPDGTAPGGEVWYVGTDGGLFESRDRLATVDNLSLSGLGVSQYYAVHTSRRNPRLVIAGAQDQGYQRAALPASPPPPPGPWGDFSQLISGDYGHVTSSNGAHDFVYSVYPGFVLVQKGEENPQLLYPWVNFPAGESYLWMPFIAADPSNVKAFFFCATHLYRYVKGVGVVWKVKLHSAQSFTPGYLSAVAFSPVDPDRVFAATTQGRLYRSDDGGVTWTLGSTSGPGSHYFYGTALLPSSLDREVCWAGGSGYGNNAVYRTTDGGTTWQPAGQGLPSTLVYCLAEAPDQSGRVFCGTENGAWVFDPGTGLWTDILGTDAPITIYWACEAVPSSNTIRFGTYGRGIWDLVLDSPGYFPYGELRDGANTLCLRNDAPPLLGKPTTFRVTGCPAGAAGALLLSPQPAELALVGGTVLVFPSGLVMLSLLADGSGEAKVTFTYPKTPGLEGKEYYFQAAVQDAAQPQGWALSQGLRALIGKE